MTRSRAYKKNDQAWVEQKNGAIVRRLVGYGRLEGVGALRCLNRLYAAARLQVNLCHPSFKLKSKHRVGAKIRKTRDRPRTPADRLLGRTDLDPSVREKVTGMSATADPLELIRRIRDEQAELGHRLDRRGLDDGRSLEPTVTGSLPTAARSARATTPEPVHQRAYRRKKKPVPAKPSRLDPFIADFRVWLTLDPGLTALAIEERLTGQHGNLVSLRTIQRLVKRIRTDLTQAEMGAASASASQAA